MIRIFSLITSVLIILGVNSVSNIEALVTRQASAWERGDVSTIIGDFAPNAEFIAAGKAFPGVAAIEKSAKNYFRQVTDTQVSIKRIIIDRNLAGGAVEWDWSDRNRRTGQVSKAEDAIVFELRDDGKITYWREYIEKKSNS
jgi:uncharacterized protein (TIGR02246 family)